MKLIAALQIFILMGSVIIPEGPHLVLRSCQCGDECQCSEESRQSGTCCCGKKSEAASNSEAESDCCQAERNDVSKIETECCGNPKPVKQAMAACCQQRNLSSETSLSAGQDSVADGDAACSKATSCDSVDDAIGCGCRQTVVHIMVVLMPRLRPAATTLQDNPDVIAVLHSVSDRTIASVLRPEVPPPKKLFLV